MYGILIRSCLFLSCDEPRVNCCRRRRVMPGRREQVPGTPVNQTSRHAYRGPPAAEPGKLSDVSWVSEKTHGHVRARDSVVNTFVIIPSLCCWELFALLNHPRVWSIFVWDYYPIVAIGLAVVSTLAVLPFLGHLIPVVVGSHQTPQPRHHCG